MVGQTDIDSFALPDFLVGSRKGRRMVRSRLRYSNYSNHRRSLSYGGIGGSSVPQQLVLLRRGSLQEKLRRFSLRRKGNSEHERSKQAELDFRLKVLGFKRKGAK